LETQLEARLQARVHAVLKTVHAAPLLSPGIAQPFSWSLKTDQVGILEALTPADLENAGEIIIEINAQGEKKFANKLETLAAKVGRERIRLALPLITREWERQNLTQAISHFRLAGYEKWEIGNLSGLTFLSGERMNLSGDWTLYATNRAAIQELRGQGLQKVTLSVEDGLENLKQLLPDQGLVVVVYQDTPLFISETCPYAGLSGGCPGRTNCLFSEMELVSAFGDQLLAMGKNCRTVIINKEPFCLASRLRELAAIGAVNLRADFIHRRYPPEEFAQIWRALRRGDFRGGHQGNFDRGF
jgi:hypothetical protein